MSKYCNVRDCIESQDISGAKPCQLCISECEKATVSMHIADSCNGYDLCIRCEHCGFSSQMFGDDFTWHYEESDEKLGYYERYENQVEKAVKSWNMIQKLIAKSI